MSKKSSVLQAIGLNNHTFWDWYYYLKTLKMASIRIVNLPSTCDLRYFVLSLFEKGSICFFKDPLIGYLSLNATEGGGYNIYQKPLYRYISASNGYNTVRTIENSVMIYNNMLRQPSEMTCRLYAYKLHQICRTQDINVNGQKTPTFFVSNDDTNFTVRNIAMQHEDNETKIYSNKKLDLDSLVQYVNVAPYVSDKLEVLKHQYINEWLTREGIENSNQDKKERLVSSEVNGNVGAVEQGRNISLVSINEGLQEANEMFGLDMYAEFRSELISNLNSPDLIASQYDNNGNDHDELYDTQVETLNYIQKRQKRV